MVCQLLFKPAFVLRFYREGTKAGVIYFDMQVPVITQELQVYSFFIPGNRISDSFHLLKSMEIF